jgi:hypothetical protein
MNDVTTNTEIGRAGHFTPVASEDGAYAEPL